MEDIKLTREEKRELKEYLYADLVTKSEYHYDLYPCKKDSLNKLMQKYFYWGDEYNDGYIPEVDFEEDNRMAIYLAQEFKKLMAIPISIRY